MMDKIEMRNQRDDTNLSRSGARKLHYEAQLTTSFPGENQKPIDYVIVYKHSNKIDPKAKKEKDQVRQSFFDKLREEKLELKHLEFRSNTEMHNYVLIHCPLERLMKEAQLIKLQMRLKNVYFEEEAEDEIELKLLKKIKTFFGIKRNLKKDNSGVGIVSTEFDETLKGFFEGFDEKPSKGDPGPFSSTIRSLLVDNILKNITFLKKKPVNLNDKTKTTSTSNKNQNVNESVNTLETNPKKRDIMDKFSKRHINEFHNKKKMFNFNSKSGLPYMLEEKYFDDALILHDQTNHYVYIQQIIESLDNQEDDGDVLTEEDFNSLSLKPKVAENNQTYKGDIRKELHQKWASLKAFYKLQPIHLIRQYFGEIFGLYFAWLGTFIYTLYLPTLIGFIFFFVGIGLSVQRQDSNSPYYKNGSVYGNKQLDIFADAFDNELTPAFAFIICIWGAFFMEFWQRENAKLAFEWDVVKFEKEERELPEYIRRTELRKEKNKDKSKFVKYLWSYEQYAKRFVSFLILIAMLSLVAMDIAAVVLLRIYLKVKVFPNDKVAQVLLGDVGSLIINTILIMIFNFIYDYIATILTKWENYRTKTQYEDALILKLFVFQFVNSYGSLFYIAFFRNIEYTDGLFNLGPEYQDKCETGNCMALLTIQVLIVLLVKPLPSFLTTVIWPLFILTVKKLKIKYQTKNVLPTGNLSERGPENIQDYKLRKTYEKIVTVNIAIEKNKPESVKAIAEEYTEKVILYGYIMLFACSFSLGPLIVLLIIIIDLRVDAMRFLWLFRRPVGYKAQDIGTWFYIIRFLNVVGIVSNAFIIAFTSNWSKVFLEDKLQNRLIFVVVFEHTVFVIWYLILIIFPQKPRSIQEKIREEEKTLKEFISTARVMKSSLENQLVRRVLVNEDLANSNQVSESDLDKYKILSDSDDENVDELKVKQHQNHLRAQSETSLRAAKVERDHSKATLRLPIGSPVSAEVNFVSPLGFTRQDIANYEQESSEKKSSKHFKVKHKIQPQRPIKSS